MDIFTPKEKSYKSQKQKEIFLAFARSRICMDKIFLFPHIELNRTKRL